MQAVRHSFHHVKQRVFGTPWYKRFKPGEDVIFGCYGPRIPYRDKLRAEKKLTPKSTIWTLDHRTDLGDIARDKFYLCLDKHPLTPNYFGNQMGHRYLASNDLYRFIKNHPEDPRYDCYQSDFETVMQRSRRLYRLGIEFLLQYTSGTLYFIIDDVDLKQALQREGPFSDSVTSGEIRKLGTLVQTMPEIIENRVTVLHQNQDIPFEHWKPWFTNLLPAPDILRNDHYKHIDQHIQENRDLFYKQRIDQLLSTTGINVTTIVLKARHQAHNIHDTFKRGMAHSCILNTQLRQGEPDIRTTLDFILDASSQLKNPVHRDYILRDSALLLRQHMREEQAQELEQKIETSHLSQSTHTQDPLWFEELF